MLSVVAVAARWWERGGGSEVVGSEAVAARLWWNEWRSILTGRHAPVPHEDDATMPAVAEAMSMLHGVRSSTRHLGVRRAHNLKHLPQKTLPVEEYLRAGGQHEL